MRLPTRLAASAAATACLAVVLTAMPASAANYFGLYTSTGGTPMSASLFLTTEDSLNTAGGYTVTALSGDVDGDAIASLVANPNQPHTSVSADGLWNYDNNYFVDAPFVAFGGLLFLTVSGTEYNLYSLSPTAYALEASFDGHYGAASRGNFAVGVPEPAAWALMLAGFALAGATLRRRRAANLAA